MKYERLWTMEARVLAIMGWFYFLDRVRIALGYSSRIAK